LTILFAAFTVMNTAATIHCSIGLPEPRLRQHPGQILVVVIELDHHRDGLDDLLRMPRTIANALSSASTEFGEQIFAGGCPGITITMMMIVVTPLLLCV
jgi:hypothetical protein